MADLAKLIVRLELQQAQLLTELEKANRKIDKFASNTTKTLTKWSAGLLAAFSGRALLQFGQQVIDTEASLSDLAQKTGVSVEALSSLGYAAGQSGSDLDGLAVGLTKLAKTSTDAATGSGAAADAFDEMGISAQNSDKSLKSTDKLLLEIADSFAAHADGATKSALAQQLFGKSGADLIPFLNKGAAGIAELTKRADELGITLSSKDAQAASELNDSLSTLGQITRGVVAKALADVVPALTNFNNEMINGDNAADTLNDSARVLAAGLKILVSTGVIIAAVFDRLGSAVGAAGAAIVAVVQGNFREAVNIVIEANKDHIKSAEATGDKLAAIWAETGDNVLGEVKVTVQRIKEQFAATTSGVGEIKIRLAKIDVGPMEQFYKDLDTLTATSQEKAISAVNEQQAALDELAASRKVTDEEQLTRQDAINKARNDALGITKLEEDAEARRQKLFADGAAVFESTRTPVEQYEAALVRLNNLLAQGAIDQDTYARAVDDAQQELDKASGKMTDFAEQARRNTQDILGQGLVDIVKGSTSDILGLFYDMITQLAAQAVAADIAGKLFGTEGKGGGGGYVGAAFDFLGGLFGGKKDSGGRGKAGMAYAIGTGAQPEVFVPDTAGTFYPRGEGMGGGGKVQQNIYVTGRVDQRSARQLQLEALKQQRTANARLG